MEPDKTHQSTHANPAVELIRRKIDALYSDEPNARAEIKEAAAAQKPRSKHQEYMYQLSVSGKSLAEIQHAWHTYYASLPDVEKREVWQEFYSANNREAQPPAGTVHATTHYTEQQPKIVVSEHQPIEQSFAKPDRRTPATIKHQIVKKVRASHNAQLKAKQHFQSLGIGLGFGAIALLIFLFGLFNEVVVTPFIRPAQANATPIILSTDGVAPSAEPKVIIPKINVELPVIYGSQSIKEEDVQKALQDGIYHYPTTATPGQQGNAAFFGHSSNNIFNKGKYKFAFVLLHELAPGDIFYLTYNSKVYAYRVYDKKVVNPDETWVLNPVAGKLATATLITCDPPGTSKHRLVVWGEQISPDPNGNTASSTPSPVIQSVPLAGNGQNPLVRLWHWATPF
jgi:LPXTG-site transpeptidase (sortase) family protein